MTNPHTALVIGANGVLGSTIASTFAGQRWKVIRGARTPGDARDAVHVDLTEPDTVACAMKKADLTVNTVPDTGMIAEKTTLEQGGTLLNISTVDPSHLRALRRSANCRAHGTVILNAGLAPGVTSLVAADLLEQHPEATTIEIVLTLSSKGMSGRAGIDFVHRNLIDSGRHGSDSGVHDTEVIPLPAPIGRRRCLGFAERERGWIESLTHGRRVHTYACFDSAPLHASLLAMNKTRLLGALPKGPFMARRGSVPKTPSTEPVAHWVSVGTAETRLAARTIECRGDYRSTASAAVIFAAAALDSAAARRPGCFGPEELFSLRELRGPLSSAGIEVVDQPVGPPIVAAGT
jgi:hypothetical protein